MEKSGFRRLRSDGSVYVHKNLLRDCRGISVCGLMNFGMPDGVKNITQKLRKQSLLEKTGALNNDEDKARRLGRNRERSGDTIFHPRGQ